MKQVQKQIKQCHVKDGNLLMMPNAIKFRHETGALQSYG